MKKKEIDKSKYKDTPHFDLIKENETITIPSLFMFEEIDDFFCVFTRLQGF